MLQTFPFVNRDLQSAQFLHPAAASGAVLLLPGYFWAFYNGQLIVPSGFSRLKFNRGLFQELSINRQPTRTDTRVG